MRVVETTSQAADNSIRKTLKKLYQRLEARKLDEKLGKPEEPEKLEKDPGKLEKPEKLVRLEELQKLGTLKPELHAKLEKLRASWKDSLRSWKAERVSPYIIRYSVLYPMHRVPLLQRSEIHVVF